MVAIDIQPGEKYKEWTVLKRVANYKRERAYLCRCKCGKEKILPSQKLRRGDECFMCKECSYDAKCTHGDARQSRRGKRTNIYIAWDNMLRRCENPNHPEYKCYGGRGIKVCEEWHKYDAFREWSLANGWEKGLSIDRIDNNSGYMPSNCRWTDQKTQIRNSRIAKWETIDGITKTRGDWLLHYKISDWFVRDRMHKYGISFREAVQMPKLRCQKRKEIR